MIDPNKIARGEALAAEVRAEIRGFGLTGDLTASYVPRKDVVRVGLPEHGVAYPARSDAVTTIARDLRLYARRRQKKE